MSCFEDLSSELIYEINFIFDELNKCLDDLRDTYPHYVSLHLLPDYIRSRNEQSGPGPGTKFFF